MSITYREAWDFFHSEQFTAAARAPRIAEPTTSTAITSIQQERLPSLLSPSQSPTRPNFIPQANLAHAPNIPNAQTTQISQTSSLEMMKELQSLRQQLRQLQVAGGESSQAGSSSTDPSLSGVGDTGSRPDSSHYSDDSIQQQQRGPNSGSGLFFCREPCCNGRQFSNKSNFIRHQRERRGELPKLRCSFCNAVFSRSSARNAHEATRRCRRK
ncbi:hypothetical protein EMCG_09387 [[Emmonsia] crescens]|uniref:C2H2-type domain-containing protein n=1 Tax=[Emmonsia] crescens TaxID=73230 RepID=A0A0G2I3C4_9EURO|nr:hypothetical protein EMCG_09387 [Emmonsia crescens UAMH 3008]